MESESLTAVYRQFEKESSELGIQFAHNSNHLLNLYLFNAIQFLPIQHDTNVCYQYPAQVYILKQKNIIYIFKQITNIFP